MKLLDVKGKELDLSAASASVTKEGCDDLLAVPPHTLLLGGIGGDSHSVGLNILRQALQTTGYQVRYLGIHNWLEEFFRWSHLSSVVLISNMDGHAQRYLREFPELLERHRAQGGHVPLFYLGGNIQLRDDQDHAREFLRMGFTRVFPRFVDIETVLEILARDLHGKAPPSMAAIEADRGALPVRRAPMDVADDRVDEQRFYSERLEVLQHWRTGHEARDLEDNARFLREQPSFAKAQALIAPGKPPLIQPRSGVALLEDQIEIFRRFAHQGVRTLSYQVDSLTRNNDYAGVEEELRASREQGSSTLNGFPVVNHGVGALRRVATTVRVPLQTRHSTRDPRLLAEISYAGGVTSFEGGPICYNIPYYKDYPVEEAIRSWQYVDRLTGLYHEQFGLVLDREFFGTLTATLIPPCLALVVTIGEALLAIQQGVKCVSLGYAEQGNRAQDVAAIRTLHQMANEFVKNLGYKDVQVHTVFHQYMAAFPESRAKAEELIEESAVTAALAGATRVITKTPVESVRIPSSEDNLRGVELSVRGTMDAARATLDEHRVTEESARIRHEVEDILNSLLLSGGSSLTRGFAEGFRRGYLDIPFSPSIHNRGLVSTARDVDGAVRFVDTGNLQIRRELREFHRHRIGERMHQEGLAFGKQNHLLVERDVMRVPRGNYDRWPLG